MHEEGYHNDFLVNVKKSDETGKAGDRYPYLMAGEVADCRGLDALFDTLETAEDDAGNVAIREPESPMKPTSSASQYPPQPDGLRLPDPKSPGYVGTYSPPPEYRTPRPAGEYFASTIVGSEVSREPGASKITTPEQAAQATAYLYKSVVERLDGIVTDANGKAAGHRRRVQGRSGAGIHLPGHTGGRGGAHPGCCADLVLTQPPQRQPAVVARRRDAQPDADRCVPWQWHRAHGPAGSHWRREIQPCRQQFRQHDLQRADPAPTSRVSVPVIERTLAPNGITGTTISSPQAAKQVARDFYDRAKQPGLMLLNSQNGVIGWVPITDQMKGELRGTGGLNAVYRAISESNAGAAIIVHGGELTHQSIPEAVPQVTPSENIAAALSRIDVRPLDSIEIRPTRTKSAAEIGMSIADGPVFARGNPFYSALTAELSRVNAAAQPALGWANTINGLVKAGKGQAGRGHLVRGAGLEAQAQEGKVTREQLVQFLDANGWVEETVLGGPAPSRM